MSRDKKVSLDMMRPIMDALGGCDIEEQVQTLKLLRAARQGDDEALKALPEVYERLPRLLSVIGNASQFMECIILEVHPFTGDKVTHQAMRLELQRIRQGLGYEQSSELERMVIDRLVLCWLQLNEAEKWKFNSEQDGVERQWASLWDRRIQIAHKNFLDAAKTLAQVRKLLYPRAAQINIGAQQVNALEAVVQQVSGQGQQLPQAQDAEFEDEGKDEEAE